MSHQDQSNSISSINIDFINFRYGTCQRKGYLAPSRHGTILACPLYEDCLLLNGRFAFHAPENLHEKLGLQLNAENA